VKVGGGVPGEAEGGKEGWPPIGRKRLVPDPAKTPGSLSRRRLDYYRARTDKAALKETHGRVAGPLGAAAKLGIPRQTLEWKIRALQIDKLAFRKG